MPKTESDSAGRARRARIERALEAFRAMRESGMSEAEQALSSAIDRMAADLAARPPRPRETHPAVGVEEETTPTVECVRRRRSQHS